MNIKLAIVRQPNSREPNFKSPLHLRKKCSEAALDRNILNRGANSTTAQPTIETNCQESILHLRKNVNRRSSPPIGKKLGQIVRQPNIENQTVKSTLHLQENVKEVFLRQEYFKLGDSTTAQQ
ncbi:hypothetical protein AVEN_216528-1 [Araneus ventricosus]|uniref:Uncharacterized protein n=1 Tax=Araneus ventricosus TaxID=182803 RepID=A0A4Y2EUC5_ARAVE|nr:hypothetical protein AVEN_216528-1 [Araneus ventricosus]